MLFGIVVKPIMLVTGGVVVLTVLVLQVLVGLRKIHFKGRTHLKVHRYGAYALLALAALHGFGGLIYAFGWRIG